MTQTPRMPAMPATSAAADMESATVANKTASAAPFKPGERVTWQSYGETRNGVVTNVQGDAVTVEFSFRGQKMRRCHLASAGNIAR